MSIKRKIECNICDASYIELNMGDGFPDWGVLTGRQDENGNAEFGLCPNHLNIIFEFIEGVKNGLD